MVQPLLLESIEAIMITLIRRLEAFRDLNKTN